MKKPKDAASVNNDFCKESRAKCVKGCRKRGLISKCDAWGRRAFMRAERGKVRRPVDSRDKRRSESKY